MQATALALLLLALVSLLGVLGPVFSPDEQGFFIMIGGLVGFGVFAGLAAFLLFGINDGEVA